MSQRRRASLFVIIFVGIHCFIVHVISSEDAILLLRLLVFCNVRELVARKNEEGGSLLLCVLIWQP